MICAGSSNLYLDGAKLVDTDGSLQVGARTPTLDLLILAPYPSVNVLNAVRLERRSLRHAFPGGSAQHAVRLSLKFPAARHSVRLSLRRGAARRGVLVPRKLTCGLLLSE